MQTSEREILRQFVTENFLFGQKTGLKDTDSFIENGVVDSTGVLELVGFLERQFGIKVEDDELIQENLDSIESLTRFLGEKLAM